MRYEDWDLNKNGDIRQLVDPETYEIVCGPAGCKPCDLCDVRELCENDDHDEYLMLCGAEWINKPLYIKLKDKNKK